MKVDIGLAGPQGPRSDSVKLLPTGRVCVLAIALLTLAASVSGQTPVTFVANGQKLNDACGRGILLADFNRDGALDAFIFNVIDHSELKEGRILFGDGRGQFADSGQRLEIHVAGITPVAVDIDGNGTMDVITGRTVWLNDGRGRFAEDSARFIDSDGAGFLACRLANLNGDNLVDVFAIGRAGARVYLNDKKGRFQFAGQQLAQGFLAAVDLGDVNGDGFVDAVLSGARFTDADPCPNRVLLNDGRGHFTETGQVFDVGLQHSHGLALGDFDRDGDLDFVMATLDSPTARLYVNDGKGRFAAGQTFGATGVAQVAVADLNGDESLDIVLACYGPNEVWLNDGRGRFTDSTVRLGMAKSWDVAVRDINGDDLPDLFVVNFEFTQAAPSEKGPRYPFAEVWLNTSRKRSPASPSGH